MQRYKNNDDRLGWPCVFTMPQMINQYKMCGWNEYETDNGIETMTDEEIVHDILTHNIEML